MNEKQLKKLEKLEKMSKDDFSGKVVIVEDLEEIDEKIEKVSEELGQKIDNIAVNVDEKLNNLSDELKKKLESELVLEIDKEELKGEKGDNYILTDKDKSDIAKSITVPIVEKVIEKTEVVKEIPIVTNEIKEVAVADNAFDIRNKLELLTDDERLDKKAIKGLEDYEEVAKNAYEASTRVISNTRNLYQLLDVEVSGVQTGQVLKWNGKNWYAGTDSGGVSTFIELTDTPSSYASQSLKSVRVKSDETGLEFYTPPTPSTPSLQQVTDVGATTTVESTFSGGIKTTQIKANSSAGTLIEANNGTDIGILGAGNTANVSWYGSHNYTGRLYAQRDNGGATPVEGMVVDNTTNATGSVLQASPSFLRRGRGFLSNSSTSYPFETQDYAIGAVGLTAYGKWIHQFKANNGTWTEFARFDTDPLGQGFSFTPAQGLSNGNPGTTRNITINNTGSHSWVDFTFSGTRKSHIGATSSGVMKFYAGGGSYFEYYQMSGDVLFSYNYPSAFVHYYNGQFGGKVGAGTTGTPTSTIYNAGSTALNVKYSIANLTLDETATQWILEPSNPACVGTPTYACSHWTNQTDCELRDSHGGCSWFAGNPCSAFNYESGMSSCSGQAGCTVETTSCAGASDESSCTSQDDSYGGSCAWSGNDCSSFDDSTCGVYVSAGCTQNYGDCSTYNGDETTCNATLGCSYDSGMGTCSGSYFTGCTGTYYECTGTYNTGVCSGTYGANCTGTSSCSGIDDSTSCGGEGGCSWSTAITATLPDGDTVPSRTVWVYKKGASGTVVLTPQSGQTVNFASSYTLSSDKEWVHLAYYRITANCSVYDANEATCGSTSGCTQNYGYCSWDGMSCSGNAVCTGIGDEGTCTSTSFFTSCSGTYTVSRNWYKFGS